MTRIVFYVLAFGAAYIVMDGAGRGEAAAWLLGAAGTLALVWEGLRET